jgi:CRP/FNR family cyclic AMP-dependent transcriptional regulator
MSKTETGLLAGLSPEDAAQVLSLGTVETLSAGSVLFRLGEDADRVYLVKRGRLALTLPMQIRGGDEDLQIEERSAGETLGWSGLISPHRFTLKATALVESELIALPRPALLAFFSSRPDVGYQMTLNLAAVIGHRLELFQAMWLREMQRVVETRYS